MRAAIYLCNVCGTQRKETNHWFLVTYGERLLMLEPWEGARPEAVDSAELHLCGAECVGKVISQFVNGGRWKQQPLLDRP